MRVAAPRHARDPQVPEEVQLGHIVRGAVGRQSADRDGEWTDAAGQVGPGQGLPAHKSPPLPADGRAREHQHSGHDLRQEEQDSRLLSELAEEQDCQE